MQQTFPFQEKVTRHSISKPILKVQVILPEMKLHCYESINLKQGADLSKNITGAI